VLETARHYRGAIHPWEENSRALATSPSQRGSTHTLLDGLRGKLLSAIFTFYRARLHLPIASI